MSLKGKKAIGAYYLDGSEVKEINLGEVTKATKQYVWTKKDGVSTKRKLNDKVTSGVVVKRFE